MVAAQTLLESLARGNPAPDPIVLGQAQSLHFLMQRFWQAVDEGRQRLVQGQTITYRQVPLTVISVTDREIVLQAADGQRRLFDTRPQQIDRDLAIALVEQRFVDAVPAASRMIGVFLAVDRDGDVSRAREYLQQAEQQGFPRRRCWSWWSASQRQRRRSRLSLRLRGPLPRKARTRHGCAAFRRVRRRTRSAARYCRSCAGIQ